MYPLYKWSSISGIVWNDVVTYWMSKVHLPDILTNHSIIFVAVGYWSLMYIMPCPEKKELYRGPYIACVL